MIAATLASDRFDHRAVLLLPKDAPMGEDSLGAFGEHIDHRRVCQRRKHAVGNLMREVDAQVAAHHFDVVLAALGGRYPPNCATRATADLKRFGV